MLFNQTTYPSFYTANDIQRKAEDITLKTIDFNKTVINHALTYFDAVTDSYFNTYTKKVYNLNQSIADDAKKIVKSDIKESKA